MLLSLDIGNTNLTIGMSNMGEPSGFIGEGRIATSPRDITADGFEALLAGLLGLGDRPLDAIVQAIVIASVIPAWSVAAAEVAARHRIPLLEATAESVPIPIRIDHPPEAGADRLVNAFAAGRLYGTPAIVVDLGTATTLDVVAADGAYIGGAIAAGQQLGLDALASRTARLPRIELAAPERVIGRDTVACDAERRDHRPHRPHQRARPPDAGGACGTEPRRLADPRRPDRRPLERAVGAGDPGHRRDRPPAHDPRPRPPPRRGRVGRPGCQGRRGRDIRLPRGSRGEGMSTAPEGRAARPLEGRLVVLGVTGSIAAYKAAELARALIAAGAEVQAAMTHSAAQFLGPSTLETLTRRKVQLDPLELLPDSRIGHIVAADTADLVIVAPATARWMAAMAAGLADDVVTAICLATAARVVVAPAMDGDMWSHPATRANADTLRSYGYVIVEPEEGPLASGAEGRGRLADDGADRGRGAGGRDRPTDPRPGSRPFARPSPPTLRGQDLDGRRLVVSAGGTAEPIDPVRFIGNRSSGRMGVAIAEAALDRGARVTLVAGTVSVPLPEDRATVLRTETTAEMRRAVLAALPGADALVMAAAVADFRPAAASATKLTPRRRADAGPRADRGHPGRGRRRGPRRASATAAPTPDPGRLRRRDRLARPGRREGRPQAASTCSWPTTSASPARASRSRPIGSRSSRRVPSSPQVPSRRRGRCSPSARSPIGCSIGSSRCWTHGTHRRRLAP